MEVKILVDTNILILALKDEPPYNKYLKSWIIGSKLSLSPITIAEFLIGANKSEANILNKLIHNSHIFNIDTNTAKLAAAIRKQKLTQKTKLHLPDCFLAATCLQHNLTFATLNPKDFPKDLPTFKF